MRRTPWAPIVLAALITAGFGRAATAQARPAPDAGKYLIQLQDRDYGTDTFTADAAGNSESEIVASPGGVRTRLHVSVRARNGRLEEIDSVSDPGGTFRLSVQGSTARIDLGSQNQGTVRRISVPTRLFPYCTAAPEQLRQILAAYDYRMGGMQSFDIVYTNRLGAAGLIQGRLSLAPLGSKPVQIAGKTVAVTSYFLQIPSPAGRLDAELFTDSENRVLMYRIESQRLLVIREGYQQLSTPPPAEPLLSVPTFPVAIERGVRTRMRDGIGLVADVYRPDTPGRFPVILQRTCRGRQSAPEASFYASRGYVFVSQDVRGKFDSEGDWQPWTHEEHDGSDTVDWCAHQRWSNGSVGMIGAGYEGFTQWAATLGNNPHLKCLIPVSSWQPDDFHFRMHDVPQIPVLHVSGWFDPNAISTNRNYQGMSASGHRFQKLIYGPWGRAIDIGTAIAGLDFGPHSVRDLETLYLRWFDHWLKGIKNGIDKDPPVEVFVMGANEWRTFTAWPPRDAKLVRWYLHSGGHANSDRSDGSISRAAPDGPEPQDHFDYDPAHPFTPAAETTGDAVDLGPSPVLAPAGDPDVLAYTSEALDTDVTVVGPLSLHLTAQTSTKDTDWFAAVEDVGPDGDSFTIAHGLVQARFRRSLSTPSPLKPGDIFAYTIDLSPTAYVFVKGHRIRVVVTSSCFPDYGRNLNTGGNNWMSTRTEIAHQTIYHSTSQRSYIVLPTQPPARRGR